MIVRLGPILVALSYPEVVAELADLGEEATRLMQCFFGSSCF